MIIALCRVVLSRLGGRGQSWCRVATAVCRLNTLRYHWIVVVPFDILAHG